MRYGPNDKFWVVVDPTPDSTMEDILFQASLKDLDLQFKGGLKIEENPTLFTDEQEAKYEAFGRITAMRAGQAILRAGRENPDTRIDRIEIYGADGKLVFEANLPGEERTMATTRDTAIRASGAPGVLERAGQHRLRLLPHPLPRVGHLGVGAMGGDHAREDGRDRPPGRARGVRGLRQGAAPDRALNPNRKERDDDQAEDRRRRRRQGPQAAAGRGGGRTPETKAPREDLCVFAFRLTEEERDAIHKAAGPAKASKFVRTLAVAAARNDEAAVRAIMKGVADRGVAASPALVRRPLGSREVFGVQGRPFPTLSRRHALARHASEQ